MEEVKKTEEINKVEKRSNIKLVFIFAAIGFFLELVALFIIKSQVETFTWMQIIWWIFGGIIIFGGALAGFYLFTRNTSKLEEEIKKRVFKQPEPITFVECHALVREMMYSPQYAQYLTNPLDEGVSEVGKNIKSSIYRQIAEGKYLVNGKKTKYVILINMHYPFTKRRIIINPKSEYEINKAVNELATFPETEKEYEEVTTTSPHLGISTTVKKPAKKEEAKKEEAKKETEDLL